MGRQLTSATVGGKTYTYTYDSNGLRTSKTVDGKTTKYYYLGNLLLGEEDPNGYTLYLYDAEESPIGMQYRASTYAERVYEKNLQGNI